MLDYNSLVKERFDFKITLMPIVYELHGANLIRVNFYLQLCSFESFAKRFNW